MSSMGCLWLFVALFTLGHCTTMKLSSSAKNGFICPNQALFFSCVGIGSQILSLSWHINMTTVKGFGPKDNITYFKNNIIFATFTPLENITRSYLEFLETPKYDLNVTCSQDANARQSIFVQGWNPLPQVNLHLSNNLPNLVKLNWDNEFDHLTQFYEVKIDDQVYSEVKSTFIIIPEPNSANTIQTVTVTSVDHCGQRGNSSSQEISGTRTKTESSYTMNECTASELKTITPESATEPSNTPPNSARTQQLEQSNHIVTILVAILVLIAVMFCSKIQVN